MIQKLKTLILSLSLLFSFSLPVVVATAPAYAEPVTQTQINNGLCKGSKIDLSNATANPGSQTCNDEAGLSLGDILRKVINVLSVLVGAIAVIMIIIGGFRYVTSAGNDTNTAAARKTILYALIGLVLVALAQVIVHFVLNNIT